MLFYKLDKPQECKLYIDHLQQSASGSTGESDSQSNVEGLVNQGHLDGYGMLISVLSLKEADGSYMHFFIFQER